MLRQSNQKMKGIYFNLVNILVSKWFKMLHFVFYLNADFVFFVIRTLCDIQNTGQLNHEQFALALHLMHKKLQGIEPPKQLPAEMIPPSLRAPAGASLLVSLRFLEKNISIDCIFIWWAQIKILNLRALS